MYPKGDAYILLLGVIQLRSQPFAADQPAYILNVSLAGLGAIRCLGRAGVSVVGFDPNPHHAGFGSRYCRAFVCPHPVQEPDVLLEFLLEEGRRLERPGVLSPASDGFYLFVSRYRNALSGYFRFVLPAPDVCEAFVDKRQLYELADRLGFNHATITYPESINDVRDIKNQIEYPVYLKPYRSHEWELKLPGYGKGIKVFSAEELMRAYQWVEEACVDVMIQRVIAGPASNVRTVYMYMDSAHEPLAALTTRKFRQYPGEFGTGSIAETYIDEPLKQQGIEFFCKSKFRGFGTIEFKYDDRDGKLYVTDVNPRWVKPINLPIDAGIDFPLMEYLDATGQQVPMQFEYRTGVRWLQLMNDLRAGWQARKAGELSLGEWGRQMASARSFATFAKDDLGPLFTRRTYLNRLLHASRSLFRGPN